MSKEQELVQQIRNLESDNDTWRKHVIALQHEKTELQKENEMLRQELLRVTQGKTNE